MNREPIVFFASGVEDAVPFDSFNSRQVDYDEAGRLIRNGVMFSPSFFKGWVKADGTWLLSEIRAALALSDADMEKILPYTDGAEVEITDTILYARFDRDEARMKFYLLSFPSSRQ